VVYPVVSKDNQKKNALKKMEGKKPRTHMIKAANSNFQSEADAATCTLNLTLVSVPIVDVSTCRFIYQSCPRVKGNVPK